MMVVPTLLASTLTTSTSVASSTVSMATSRKSSLLDRYDDAITFVVVGGVVVIIVAVLTIVVVCIIQAIYKRESSPRAAADESVRRERSSTSSVNLHHNDPYNDGSPPPNGETRGEFTGSLQELLASRKPSDPDCSAFAHSNVGKVNKDIYNRELGAPPVQIAVDGPITAAAGKPRVPCSSISAHVGTPMPTPAPDPLAPRTLAPNTVQTALSPNYESLQMKLQSEHVLNVGAIPRGGPNDDVQNRSRLDIMCNNESNARNEALGTHGLVPVREAAVQNMYSHEDDHNRPSYEGLSMGVHNAYIPPLTRITSAPSDHSLDSLGRAENRKPRSDSYVPPAGENTANCGGGTGASASDASSKSDSIRSSEHNPLQNVNKFYPSRASHVHTDVPIRDVEMNIGANVNFDAEMARDNVQQIRDCYSDITEDAQRASYVPPVDAASEPEAYASPETDDDEMSLTERENFPYIPPMEAHTRIDVEIIDNNSYVEASDNEVDIDADYSDSHDDVEASASNKTTAGARYRYI